MLKKNLFFPICSNCYLNIPILVVSTWIRKKAKYPVIILVSMLSISMLTSFIKSVLKLFQVIPYKKTCFRYYVRNKRHFTQFPRMMFPTLKICIRRKLYVILTYTCDTCCTSTIRYTTKDTRSRNYSRYFFSTPLWRIAV